MKRIIVAFLLILNIGIADAADKTITSLSYVTNQLATKQDKIPAVDTNTVITHTGTAGNIGEKGIYDSNGNYAEQQTSLVTAGDANTGINNALENEFVCVEFDSDGCLIWKIRPAKLLQLPNEYTPLEYLESTGTQYIDTGIKVKANTVAEFEYQFTVVAGYNYVFGQVAGYGACCLGYRHGDGIWWFQRNTFANIYDSLKHKVVYGMDGNAYRDDLLFATRGTYGCGNNPPDHTIVIFAERNDPQNGAIHYGRVKIYYFILKEGNNTVRNFIPVRRNSDSVLGMYDLVSGTFFTNAGAGTFTAGPVASYIPQNQ